ncbi:MAG: hypothetical protein A3K30_03150 [Deltaproteobacteria bacterium RBG_13_51_10]|nr:MAG: hypothetical protein A3K30_03150 [Deltaproteobacteria bacterium RBG_13_51_10]
MFIGGYSIFLLIGGIKDLLPGLVLGEFNKGPVGSLREKVLPPGREGIRTPVAFYLSEINALSNN